MSAPPPALPASLSTSGYQDGLGRRSLAFDREAGSVLERLIVRPELAAFERGLRQRADHLATFDDERIARVREIVHDTETQLLTVVSEFVGGQRLSDLLDEVAAGSLGEAAPPSIDQALGLLLQLLPALSALHTTAGVSHGVVGPGRIAVTAAGEIVLLDSIYAPSLERLQLSRHRLWSELRVAHAPSAGVCRFNATADIAQAALAAAAVTVGRPLSVREYPEGLGALLNEVVEIAQLRGSARFATAIQRFFERALPLPARRIYDTAEEANAAVQELVAAEMGVRPCRAALVALARDAAPDLRSAPDFDAVPASQVTPELRPGSDGASTELRLTSDHASTDLRLSSGVPATDGSTAAEPPILAGEYPGGTPEVSRRSVEGQSKVSRSSVEGQSEVSRSAVEAPAEASRDEAVPVEVEFSVAVEQTVAAAVEPDTLAVQDEPAVAPLAAEAATSVQREIAEAASPVQEPIAPPAVEEAAVDAAAEALLNETVVDADGADADVVNEAVAAEAVEPAVEPPAAAAPPAVAARATTPKGKRANAKRKRSGRGHRDRLRSTDTPPARPAAPLGAPIAAEAPVLALTPQVPVRMPSYEPLQQPAWMFAQPVPLAPIAAPAAIVPPVATVRLKPEPPRPVAPAPPRPRTTYFDDVSAHDAVASRPRDGEGSTLKWKLAAAAAVIIAIGATAGRANLLGRLPDPVAASAAPAITSAAPAEDAPSGAIAIETQPDGARVLLDGKPAGESPLKIDGVATGSHIVTLITSSATLKRAVKVEAGKTASIDVPVYSGWIAVSSAIVLDVGENGRSVGTTEHGRVMLPPGRHTLTFTNKELGYSVVKKVDIESGEERTLSIEPRGTISLNALPWAEVYIDGQRAGETPMANFSVPLGTRELLFKHPQLGERRVTEIVKATGPSVVSVDFTK